MSTHEVWKSVAARRGGLPDVDSDGRREIVLVGELNGIYGDPTSALHVVPGDSAGGRLCGVLGIVPSHAEQLATWRSNLCDGRWQNGAAVERAQLLLEGPWRAYVLLGAKVQSAFRQAVLRNHSVADKTARRTNRAYAYAFAPRRAWSPEGNVGEQTNSLCVSDLTLDVVRDRALISVRFLELPPPSSKCRLWLDEKVVLAARLAYTDLKGFARSQGRS